jgi:hypothetical protein
VSRIHPGLPGAQVRSSGEIFEDTGEVRHSINWSLTPELVEQIRQGYRCALPPHGCGAAQPEPFPEKCVEPYCNFNIKRDVLTWFEGVYAGEEVVWPDGSEGEAVRDFEREQHEFYARKSGVILPPWTRH